MILPYRPKKDVRPYYPTVLDIETEGTGGTCIGIGFGWQEVGGARHYERFADWDQWLKGYRAIYKASDKPTRLRLRRIYAHNGARFDWLHLTKHLLDTEQVVTLKSYQSGSIISGIDLKLCVCGERFSLKLRDSVRLMPGSLKELCKTFHTDNAKIDLNDELPEVTKARNEPLFWDYLRLDVLATQDVIYAFWQLIYQQVGSIDELPMTLPALAMRLWRMTLTKPVMVPWNVKLKQLERLAYVGGRTEAIQTGEYDDVAVYDVNSEYPAVMADGMFPLGYLGGWVTEYTGKHGLYTIRFNQTNRAQLPVLHLKNDKGGIDFAYSGQGTFTKPEIDLFLSVGGVIEVIEGYVYYEMGNLFKHYVDQWYGLKQKAVEQGDDGLAFICKILLNSLYGKFGQAETGWSLQIWDDDSFANAIAAGTTFKEYANCPGTVLVEESKPSETTFVGIAAYVTAYARILLYGYMQQAQQTGATVVYTDTDSIHMNGGGSLPVSSELGALKLEYQGAATYIGKKSYRLHDKNKVKAKGIGRREASLLTREQFRFLLNGGSIEVAFQSFATATEILSGQKPPAIMLTRTRTLRSTGSSPYQLGQAP